MITNIIKATLNSLCEFFICISFFVKMCMIRTRELGQKVKNIKRDYLYVMEAESNSKLHAQLFDNAELIYLIILIK